jgi:hypothetical protein
MRGSRTAGTNSAVLDPIRSKPRPGLRLRETTVDTVPVGCEGCSCHLTPNHGPMFDHLPRLGPPTGDRSRNPDHTVGQLIFPKRADPKRELSIRTQTRSYDRGQSSGPRMSHAS